MQGRLQRCAAASTDAFSDNLELWQLEKLAAAFTVGRKNVKVRVLCEECLRHVLPYTRTIYSHLQPCIFVQITEVAIEAELPRADVLAWLRQMEKAPEECVLLLAESCCVRVDLAGAVRAYGCFEGSPLLACLGKLLIIPRPPQAAFLTVFHICTIESAVSGDTKVHARADCYRFIAATRECPGAPAQGAQQAADYAAGGAARGRAAQAPAGGSHARSRARAATAGRAWGGALAHRSRRPVRRPCALQHTFIPCGKSAIRSIYLYILGICSSTRLPSQPALGLTPCWPA